MSITMQDLTETPTGRRILEEAEERKERETLAHRRELAAQLQELEVDAGKSIPPAQKALEKAEAEVRRVEADLKKAQEVRDDAARTLASLRHRLSHRSEKLQGELLRTAPNAWVECKAWVEAELGALRKPGVLQFDQEQVFNPEKGQREYRTTRSNKRSLEARMEYLVQLQHSGLSQLGLIADPEELEREIRRVQEGIPELRMESWKG